MTRNQKNTKSVTVRLPLFIVDSLDAEVAKRDTSRSEVIRRAVVTMERMKTGVFVPLSPEYKRSLLTISTSRRVPYENLLTSWVCDAISREGREKTYIQYATTTYETFIPVKSSREHTTYVS